MYNLPMKPIRVMKLDGRWRIALLDNVVARVLTVADIFYPFHKFVGPYTVWESHDTWELAMRRACELVRS